MNRGEWGVTVLGLLGTFLLPWPGEQANREARVMEQGRREQAAACRSVRALPVLQQDVRQFQVARPALDRS